MISKQAQFNYKLIKQANAVVSGKGLIKSAETAAEKKKRLMDKAKSQKPAGEKDEGLVGSIKNTYGKGIDAVQSASDAVGKGIDNTKNYVKDLGTGVKAYANDASNAVGDVVLGKNRNDEKNMEADADKIIAIQANRQKALAADAKANSVTDSQAFDETASLAEGNAPGSSATYANNFNNNPPLPATTVYHDPRATTPAPVITKDELDAKKNIKNDGRYFNTGMGALGGAGLGGALGYGLSDPENQVRNAVLGSLGGGLVGGLGAHYLQNR